VTVRLKEFEDFARVIKICMDGKRSPECISTVTGKLIQDLKKLFYSAGSRVLADRSDSTEEINVRGVTEDIHKTRLDDVPKENALFVYLI
jgi:hypothetical protein